MLPKVRRFDYFLLFLALPHTRFTFPPHQSHLPISFLYPFFLHVPSFVQLLHHASIFLFTLSILLHPLFELSTVLSCTYTLFVLQLLFILNTL